MNMEQVISTITKTRTNTKILVAIGLLAISGTFVVGAMRFSKSSKPNETTANKSIPQLSANKTNASLSLKSALSVANQKLFKLNNQYQSTAQKNQAKVLQALTIEARKRKGIMAKLMPIDPLGANQLALAADLLKQLPTEVQSFVEYTEEFEGTLVEQHTDIMEGDKFKSTSMFYFLRLDVKRQIPIFFSQTPKDLERGTRIKVQGVFLKNVGLAAFKYSILSRPPLTTKAGPIIPMPTEKKMAVVLIKFADQASIESSYPNAVSILQSGFFESDPPVGISSLKHFFLTTSYGKELITGSAAGWVQLPENSDYYYENYGYDYGVGTCLVDPGFFQAVVNAADPLVNWSGVDLLSVVYFLPEEPCGTQALTIGDDEKIEFSSDEGIFRAGVAKFKDHLPMVPLIAHEIGHNFGLEHAQGWDCPGNVGADLQNPEASPCRVVNYGDDDDMMGAYTSAFLPTFLHFSAARKEQLGWLAPAQSRTIGETGNYSLNALEPSAGTLKQLKILLGHIGFYSIEYRQNLLALAQDGVVVRFVANQRLSGFVPPNGSLRPGTPAHPETALISAGQSFMDPYRGIKIQLTAKTGSRAMIRIEIEQCDNIDNTGEGIIDEGCDDDNDNYCDSLMTIVGTPSVCTAGGGDTNDANAFINIDTSESETICNDIDDNGNGIIDEGCDNDDDNYCGSFLIISMPSPTTCTAGGGDSDDFNPDVNPGTAVSTVTVGYFTCSDDDGGNNPNIGGTVTLTSTYWGDPVTIGSYPDICLTYGINELFERYCNPISAELEQVSAPCTAGQTCIDPDGNSGPIPAYCGIS